MSITKIQGNTTFPVNHKSEKMSFRLINEISDRSTAQSLEFENSSRNFGTQTVQIRPFRDAPFAKTDNQRFRKVAQGHFAGL